MKYFCIYFCFIISSTFTFAQVNFTKYGTEPVLQRDTVFANLSQDFYAISDNWILLEDGVYKMWYTCGGFNYPTDGYELCARICYCESDDGITWDKYDANPVLDKDYGLGWDSLGVETVTVIIDEDALPSERYKMWYAGVNDADNVIYKIGYATSADGLSWTKHPAPVLEQGGAGEWDTGFLEGPSVIKDGLTYKMWYAALDSEIDGGLTDGQVNIGYATSTDGITWTKSAANPVLTVSSIGWDSIYVQDPHVIKKDGTYHMWYGGANQYDNYGQKTGYATSDDGINWVKSASNPVLLDGDAGTWDDNTASFPTVLLEGTEYKIWYTGKDVHPLPATTEYYWEIGYASGSFAQFLESTKTDFSYYPNPADHTIFISSEFSGNIILQDAFGKVLISERIENGQINVETLPAGLYYLTLNTISKKIIIY